MDQLKTTQNLGRALEALDDTVAELEIMGDPKGEIERLKAERKALLKQYMSDLSN